MLLLKQCRHTVQKVKYDQKIYIRKNTSLSSNLVPRVNTFAFWTCSLRYSPSCFQASFTTTALSSVNGFCCSALISYPGNESLAFPGHPLPTSPPLSPITLLVTVTGSVIARMLLWPCRHCLLSFLIVQGVSGCARLSCITWYLSVVSNELLVAACRILFPGQRWNLGPPNWELRALATGLLEKSLVYC